MCEIQAVLTVAALLSAATGFCRHHVDSEKNWDTTAKSKVKILAKKSTKNFV